MKIKNSVFIILLSCLISCKEKDTKNDREIFFDITTWKENRFINDSIIQNLSFIPLEFTSECKLRYISKIIPGKNNYYICDVSQPYCIYIFTKYGKFVKRIGKQGRGPGEFIQIKDFDLNEENDHIIVLDAILKKILLFSISNGEFIKDIKLNFTPGSFAFSNNDFYSFYVLDIDRKLRDFSITNLSLTSNSFINLKKRDEYDLNFGLFSRLYKSENLYYVPYLNNKIFQIEKNSLYVKYRFNFGDHKISENELKECHKNGKDISMILNKSNIIFGIGNVIENKKFMTLSLRFKSNKYNFVYNKKSKDIYYGMAYTGLLEHFGFIENLAVNDDSFIGSLDGFTFLRMKKRIIERNSTDPLFTEYISIAQSINENTNPILLLIEYK